MKKPVLTAMLSVYIIAALTGAAFADVSGAGIITIVGGTILAAVLGIAVIIVAAALLIKEISRRKRDKK